MKYNYILLHFHFASSIQELEQFLESGGLLACLALQTGSALVGEGSHKIKIEIKIKIKK